MTEPTSYDLELAILIPHRDLVNASFAFSLKRLEHPAATTIVTCDKIPLDNARNLLVKKALSLNAEWFLWLDTDVSMPNNLYAQLRATNRKLASGLYFADPALPLTLRRFGDGYRPAPIEDTIMEVDATGMGCLLTHNSLFRNTPAPWFEFCKVPDRTKDDENALLGEDIYFFEKILKHTGETPVIDPNMLCGHEVPVILR